MTSQNLSDDECYGFSGLVGRGIAQHVARRLQHGTLRLTLPDGSRHVIVGRHAGPTSELSIHRWRALGRLYTGGVGFAEGYICGDWETADLGSLLELLAYNLASLTVTRRPPPWRRAARLLQGISRRNTRSGSRRNIASHYDLGNAFYALWLDPTLTYSGAVFERPGVGLEAAQIGKYRAIASLVDLRPEHHLLEIGCGWAGFAGWAAKEIGCRVTAVTISQAQYDYSAARIHAEGLADRIILQRLDYRDITGSFDRIVSIEMFEAVGEAYWSRFFHILRERLKPAGRAALQVITIDEAAYERYRRGVDFIQAYIFPGGKLPTIDAMRRGAAGAGLVWRHSCGRGTDYATTLAMWRENFERAWPDILALGFDERFRRMWRYYLAYCEAGFRVGRLDLQQIALDRG